MIMIYSPLFPWYFVYTTCFDVISNAILHIIFFANQEHPILYVVILQIY